MLLREESIFLISDSYLYLAQWLTSLHTHTHTDSYLYVESICRCKAALLEQSMKMLGEHERVWTERVPVERRFPDVKHVLHLAQAVALQHLTHFFNTTKDKGDLFDESVGAWVEKSGFIFSYIYNKHC